MKSLMLPRWQLPWPLPALTAWALAWALFLAMRGHGALWAGVAAALLGGCMAWLWTDRPWRRGLIFSGFPLSLLLSGLASQLAALTHLSLSSAAWLLPLLLLASIYPVQAWRDAPMFPTPALALLGLAEATALPAHSRLLDAGCGLGHGLQALRSACPAAQIEGIERSWPLRALAGWRCPWATVRQGDMWAADWGGYQLVYLFQRPESMAAAWAKAQRQMAPGSWLASLEFAVADRAPDAALGQASDKPLWLYRIPGEAADGAEVDRALDAQPRAAAAEKTPGRQPARAGNGALRHRHTA